MLEHDEIPQKPGRVLSLVHVVGDELFDHFMVHQALLFDPGLVQVLIHEEPEFFSKPGADGHLEPPFRPLLNQGGEEVRTSLQKNSLAPGGLELGVALQGECEFHEGIIQERDPHL